MSLQSSDIVFLTEEEILLIHRSILQENETAEIFNQNNLNSAINQPQATFDGEFLYKDICEMAAAYLISFAKDHAFYAGNKRIALSACSIFLQRNNHRLLLDNNEAAELILKCVTGEYSKEDVIEIISKNIA